MKLNYMLAYYRVLSRFFNQVGHETTHVKTVPVNFVVNTVLIQHCVYYKIFWNSLYLVEISIFSLNNVTVRPTKIKNRADKNWAHF